MGSSKHWVREQTKLSFAVFRFLLVLGCPVFFEKVVGIE
jgi:hypothetical protein